MGTDQLWMMTDLSVEVPVEPVLPRFLYLDMSTPFEEAVPRQLYFACLRHLLSAMNSHPKRASRQSYTQWVCPLVHSTYSIANRTCHFAPAMALSRRIINPVRCNAPPTHRLNENKHDSPGTLIIWICLSALVSWFRQTSGHHLPWRNRDMFSWLFYLQLILSHSTADRLSINTRTTISSFIKSPSVFLFASSS